MNNELSAREQGRIDGYSGGARGSIVRDMKIPDRFTELADKLSYERAFSDANEIRVIAPGYPKVETAREATREKILKEIKSIRLIVPVEPSDLPGVDDNGTVYDPEATIEKFKEMLVKKIQEKYGDDVVVDWINSDDDSNSEYANFSGEAEKYEEKWPLPGLWHEFYQGMRYEITDQCHEFSLEIWENGEFFVGVADEKKEDTTPA